jgi:tripartite-type tricarboxylate transporter receptor subunit TctC
MQRRQLVSWGAGLVGIAALNQNALQAQPATTKIIVPFAAGGPIDITARLLAEKVRDQLGQVIIENRPGAGGGIGVAAVARAPADGLTLGIAAVAMHAINPWLTKVQYDPIKDFLPITQMVRIPNVLVMNAQTAKRLNITNLQSFIAYAKANPAKLNYGSGGNGSAGHLGGEMFKARAGIFAVHIAYGGGAPAQQALLSGEVDFTLDNLATVAANLRSGRIVALAVTSAKRDPQLPDVPALAETFSGFEIDTWWGLIAPAGVAATTISKLNTAFTNALRMDETKARFAQLMAEPTPTTADQFADLIKREHARYEKVIKAANIKLD